MATAITLYTVPSALDYPLKNERMLDTVAIAEENEGASTGPQTSRGPGSGGTTGVYPLSSRASLQEPP